MSIFPLQVFEEDADPSRRDALTDQERYDALEPPKSIVVRYGYMRNVAEYRYEGDAKPGCGTKLVARTNRGTEVVEMLTTTCENAGCGKSLTRKEMLQYIEQSGGKDFPFRTDGRVLRVASIEDLNRWSRLRDEARDRISIVKEIVSDNGLDIKIIEAEPVLSEEMLTIYYMSEEKVDFRDTVKELASRFAVRIEMRQVGARDEARLVADYERCGQHCCCKNFLKVLKPVSMRSAKVQKATLDPLKISGRCGRLMCCLRYEDQTYAELKKNLPHRKTRVGTSEGPGIVMETKILVQLALVKLEHDGREIAVPVEELMDPDECPRPGEAVDRSDPLRGMDQSEVSDRTSDRRRRNRGRKSRSKQQEEYKGDAIKQESAEPREAGEEQLESPSKKRRRRRRRRKQQEESDAGAASPEIGEAPGQTETTDDQSGPRKKRRRRRRRRRGGGGSGSDDAPGGSNPDSA